MLVPFKNGFNTSLLSFSFTRVLSTSASDTTCGSHTSVVLMTIIQGCAAAAAAACCCLLLLAAAAAAIWGVNIMWATAINQ